MILNADIVNIISLIWVHISTILGITGNIFVLFTTTRHKAIKLDEVSIWTIQQLSVADLANCILVFVPITTVLYSNDTWVLGDTFCGVFAIYVYSFTVANIFLINVFSLNKLARCLLPLRTLAPSRKQKLAVTMVTLIASLLCPMWMLYGLYIGNFMEITFFKSQCTCSALFTTKVKDWQKSIPTFLSLTLTGIPCVVLVITNTILVVYAMRKSTNAVNRLNHLIVVLVTCTFLFSILPSFIMVLQTNNWGENLAVRIAYFLTFINSWSNPVVYLVTNPSFRRFTSGFFNRTMSRVKDCVQIKCLRDNKVVSSESLGRDERCTDNYSGVAPRGIGSDSRIEFVIEDRV